MREITAKKGPFAFFALILRADAVGGDWELVVSAPWLMPYDLKSGAEFTRLLGKSIGRKSLVELARIAVVSPTDPTLRKLMTTHAVEDGEVRISRTSLFGHDIDDGIILRAKRAA